MAKITLDIQASAKGALDELNNLQKNLTKTRETAISLNKAMAEAGIKSAISQQKAADAALQTISTLQKLKEEYKNLITEAANSGASQSEAGQKALASAEAARAKMEQINTAMANTGKQGEALAGVSSSLNTLKDGFGALVDIQSLLGLESEKFKAILDKINTAVSLNNNIQALSNNLKKDGALATHLQSAAQAVYTTVVGTSTGALRVFKLALAATGIGLIIVAIGELVAHWDDLTEAIGLSNKQAEEFSKLKKEAADSVVSEVGKVELLISKYDAANTSQEERKKIINELKEISPAYFGHLKAEGENIDALTMAYKRYANAMVLKAQAEKLADKVAQKNIEIQEKGNQTPEEVLDSLSFSDRAEIEFKITKDVFSGSGTSTKNTLKYLAGAIYKQQAALQSEADTYQKQLEDTLTKLNKAGGDPVKSTQTQANTPVVSKEEVQRQRAEKLRTYLKSVTDFKEQVEKEVESFKSPEEKLAAQRNAALEKLKSTEIKMQQENKKAHDEKLITDAQYENIEMNRKDQFNILRQAAEQRYQQEQLDLLRQQQNQAIDIMANGREKEIAQVEQGLKEMLEKYKVFGPETEETAKLNDAIRLRAHEKARQDIAAINFKYNTSELDFQQEHSKAQVDLLQRSGMSEVEFERFKEEEKLKIDIEFAQKKIILLRAALAGAGTNEQQNIQKQIDDLQSTIADGQKKLAALGEQTEKFSLARALFGNATDGEGNPLTDAEFAAIDEDLQTMLNSAVSAITDAIDFQISKNQELIDSIKKRIEAQEDVVKKEEELQKKGLANNVKTEKERLKQLQKQQEDAVAKQKKLAKEKAAIDAVTQAVSLVTASAQIIQSLSSAGPIGVAIAAVTIAAMVGAFIASRIKIAQTVGQGYYKGGYTGDGSATDEAGIVHKREFVFTADDTKKHRHLFEGIHNNDNAKIQAGILDLLNDTGVTLPETGVVERLRIVHDNANAQRTASANELAGLRGDVQAIAERMDALAGKQREQVINTQSDTFIKKGLKTTRLK